MTRYLIVLLGLLILPYIVFAAILDDQKGGRFEIAPRGKVSGRNSSIGLKPTC